MLKINVNKIVPFICELSHVSYTYGTYAMLREKGLPESR